MEHVTKPRGESLPPRAPTFNKVQEFFDYLVKTDRLMWLAVRLTLSLGLRRSELLALKYGDLVLDRSAETIRGSLRIEKGVVRIPGDEHEFIQTATKSGAPSHRTLGMDEELCRVFSGTWFQTPRLCCVKNTLIRVFIGTVTFFPTT